jgi:hypothetical protein
MSTFSRPQSGQSKVRAAKAAYWVVVVSLFMALVCHLFGRESRFSGEKKISFYLTFGPEVHYAADVLLS